MSNLDQQDGPARLAAGTIVDGRYKIARCIGQGGSGLVYEVEHVRTGRRLAMKTLIDGAGAGRLEQEAKATSLLGNAHAAKITDMGTAPPAGPYLVMDLLEGQSLRALLEDAGQLPLELTVNIGLQVCECLVEAHRHQIVHRDLKPENVFLCASSWPNEYDVKVLDFGVVKIAGEGPIPNSSLTRTGSTVGTPYYMSLEQLRNSSAVDARADIYSLGVVLYECLSGKKPFQADTIGDLVYALCSGPPPHLGRLRPDLPTPIVEVVMRSLAMNREERPKTMLDLATALLPHGNNAFGLWLKQGARPGAGQSKVPAVPPKDEAKAPPVPRATQRLAPGAGPPPRHAPPPASPPSARVAAPPTEDLDAPGRNTPTEMYMGAPGAPPPAPGGDRDTPTRAIRADLIEEEARRRAGALENEVTDQAPQLGFSLMQTVPAPSTTAVLSLPGLVAPLGPPAPLPIPPAPFGPPQMGFAPAALAPSKPAWQLAMDRWLTAVGGAAETWPARYRAMPKNMRLLAIACAVSVGMFVVAVVLFLFVR